MGMNVAFSSSTDNYNPSDWITGSWYNSEIGEYPGYGIADLPVGEGYVFGLDLLPPTNLLKYQLQQLGSLQSSYLAWRHPSRLWCLQQVWRWLHGPLWLLLLSYR